MSDPAPKPARRRSRTIAVLSLAIGITAGLLVGIGSFTFGYAEGLSYLSNDPNSCTNCHVMQHHFDSWQRSAHHHVAVCNDCHLPHHPIGKWVTKADNGFFHSVAFTLDNFHEPIRIKPRNRIVTQNACLRCHDAMTDQIHTAAGHAGDSMLCIHCHADVGHGP